MEIDCTNFWRKLPSILKAISEAKYVSVDLEMSGISAKPFLSKPTPSIPTLQEIYDGARVAAEMYTILQFGLTCINWEPEKKSYVTKTFNLPLHPGVVGDSVASKHLASVLDRRFRLSTSSLGFLEGHGFSILDVFSKGVPYLSDSEAGLQSIDDFIEGKRQANDRIDVDRLSSESREFYRCVQEQVYRRRHFMELSDVAPSEAIEVYGPHKGRLNSLQKRLIHQIVEDQLENCRAYPRNGGTYMEISKLDGPGEGPHHIDVNHKYRKQAVAKQTGARLLWDAICGKPFADKIDSALIFRENSVEAMQLDITLKKYERQLRNQQPIFVGHNLFWDLCFLHSMFVGPLPESVDAFRTITGEELPRIVDTKYLFTRGTDEMSPDLCLSECFDAEAAGLPPVPPLPPMPELPPVPYYNNYQPPIVVAGARQVGKAVLSSASKGNLLEERDEDVAALAKFETLQPEASSATKAPPTPAQTPEPKPKSHSRVPGSLPEWDEKLWHYYGNRSRVGVFGRMFYTGN
ncbi:hypothetical protein N8I77_007215 [Diaporthe amygdali]|uniref:Uncharacterized protein n=1 Tax=Phomopsis amygdali TaxID=1214568 RepID=A0AAD9SDY6_PHOAM|nr:hypothetical protein N8I77_007215 [Diaporthe amygdali]